MNEQTTKPTKPKSNKPSFEKRIKAWTEEQIRLAVANSDIYYGKRHYKLETEIRKNKKTMFFMFLFLVGAIAATLIVK